MIFLIVIILILRVTLCTKHNNITIKNILKSKCFLKCLFLGYWYVLCA